MPRYVIKKRIDARSIKDALKREDKAELISVEISEPEETQSNTHAIGFHIPPDSLETESYDPSP
jgi:hypothetical protein